VHPHSRRCCTSAAAAVGAPTAACRRSGPGATGSGGPDLRLADIVVEVGRAPPRPSAAPDRHDHQEKAP
jgi:hypothetical protein